MPSHAPHAAKRLHAPRVTPISLAVGLLALATTAQAQTTATLPAQLDAVVVTGIRRSLETAVNLKRGAEGVVEAIAAEDLGKLPDASIAEALARLPGLTGQRGADGRVDKISIRGLSPEFSGVLLNGREMVSSNDSRAVEFDQFPSELISTVVVYKTPDGALIGQGLSGTADIRTVRPLSVNGRQVALNVRGERNSNPTMVPGVTSATGMRVSASYVEQFAGKTLGVAVGFARLDSPTQTRKTELVQYGDYAPYGLPISGNAPSKVGTGQSMLPMFWTVTGTTKKNVRDGLMAVVEYQPNADLHTQLDLYYSKFKTHEVGGKFAQSLFGNWSAGISPALSNVSTVQRGDDTYTTQATASQLVANVGNFDTRRTDDITAVGWNTELKLADKWKAVSDLAFSRDKRAERYAEAYAGPYNSATKSWTYGGYRWNVPIEGNGVQTFTPLDPQLLSDPSRMAFGDVQGMDWVPNEAWIGAVRHPDVTDEVKSARFTLKRELDGFWSGVQFGLNHTQRDKGVAKNEDRILMKKDSSGNYIRSIPTSAVRDPFNMSWAGIPALLRVDVPALVASGQYQLEEGQFAKWVANNSKVGEKVTTAFFKADFDHDVEDVFGGFNLRGNAGLQAVRASQHAEGWEYRGDDEIPDKNLLYPRSGGASYTHTLPSLNLTADFRNNFLVRLGWAKTMVRPNFVDMRAGTSTPRVLPDVAGTPHAGEWTTAYGGNPALKPWLANGWDLSMEKYFGKRSYIALAQFHKNLTSYIYNQLTAISSAGFPTTSAPAGVTPKDIAPMIQPLNGTGGKVDGTELAFAFEADLLHDALKGFGIVASASKLRSSIKDQNPDPTVSTARDVPLNGLSGRSNSFTVYYEDHGFSLRFSQRYRSPFTATTRDIFLNNTTQQQGADKVQDLQLGYGWESGDLKGLSLLLQIGNLQDRATNNFVSVQGEAPDKSQLTPNFITRFGRTTLVGVNYRF